MHEKCVKTIWALESEMSAPLFKALCIFSHKGGEAGMNALLRGQFGVALASVRALVGDVDCSAC